MRFPVVLFDLDGTVIDSGSIILASFRHATRSVLRRELPDAQLLAAVGGSTLRDQMSALDEERADELVDAYREHNYPLHGELEPCNGMIPILEHLRHAGRRLGIVTAKRHASVQLAFEALPLAEFFDVVVGAEDTARHKPHPDPLLLALARLGAEPHEAAYVGDSPFDVAAAKGAGVFAVAATWGAIHPTECLAAECPDALVTTPGELLDLL